MERIIVDKVSKKFRIGFRKNLDTLSRLFSFFSGRESQKSFWVLKNLSFNAEEGEVLGLIGKNGSGKSTLLRVIAGIYDTDKGSVYTHGKIISLISLYTGMQHRLTMHDNIFLCGSLFGLTRKEIMKRYDSIVKFAELENFVNTKIYQFSEGMKQRLTYSIAIHCNPQILLLDEIFEVGDQRFRQKGANKILELVRQGATVILVTHDMDMVQKYCNRVIWLDKGKIFKEGSVEKITGEYKKI